MRLDHALTRGATDKAQRQEVIHSMPETMPMLEDIKAFIEVFDRGSFVGAARVLGLRPALVTKRVARLEKTLRSRLFVRTTRRVVPTAEARAYALRCKEAARLLEVAADDLNRSQSILSGSIRVTAPSPFGRRYLAQAIARFRRAHSGVDFDLRLSDQVVDLVAEQFDVAIRIGAPAATAQMVTRKLADDERIFCASPAYVAAHGAPRNPQELVQHRYLAFVGTNGVEQRLALLGPHRQRVEVRLAASMKSDSGEALREWAIAGEGISLRSTWDVVDELRARTLVRVVDQWQPARRDICIVRPQRACPARVTQFVAFIARDFARPQWAV